MKLIGNYFRNENEKKLIKIATECKTSFFFFFFLKKKSDLIEYIKRNVIKDIIKDKIKIFSYY